MRGAVFSISKVTPLKPPVILVAMSMDAFGDVFGIGMKINEEILAYWTSGEVPFMSYQPISHCYGGHQFGYWSGQLGDGRAHIIGEYTNHRGKRCGYATGVMRFCLYLLSKTCRPREDFGLYFNSLKFDLG